MKFLYSILKKILFLIDPEQVHDFFVAFGSFLGKFSILRSFIEKLLRYDNIMLEQNLFGLHFVNPVGLSAGFDKNGDLLDILHSVGFAFTQVGTVTYGSYEGNKKPRLYRLVKSKSIVVYYGLKNIGVDKIIYKLRNRRTRKLITSVSVGRTNSKEANVNFKASIEDYVKCFSAVAESGEADFITINISCPNLHCGEEFTTPQNLEHLLKEIKKSSSFTKPVFLKMPSDKSTEDFLKLVEVGIMYGIDGVVICNLNKDRNNDKIKDSIPENVKGSLSGLPVKSKSDELISETYKRFGDKIKIIGVGGIFSAEDAYEKIKRGASLVQIITGLIFEGPQIVGDINRGLVDLLNRDGYKHISEAVGVYHKS